MTQQNIYDALCSADNIQVDPVSVGNMFQDLPWLCETMDNTEHYIYNVI